MTIVGLLDDVRNATEILGVECADDVLNDRSQLDYRRIFVSNPAVCG
ncbi:MAG: hypothetical protein HIU83_15980 [Proteobacteria bacterium]|nr:hypothetical protein [Pseudomonadota bacterium]